MTREKPVVILNCYCTFVLLWVMLMHFLVQQTCGGGGFKPLMGYDNTCQILVSYLAYVVQYSYNNFNISYIEMHLFLVLTKWIPYIAMYSTFLLIWSLSFFVLELLSKWMWPLFKHLGCINSSSCSVLLLFPSQCLFLFCNYLWASLWPNSHDIINSSLI